MVFFVTTKLWFVTHLWDTAWLKLVLDVLLTELTQSAVEILEIKVGVIRIVVCRDDIATTIIRQQLAKAQLFHAFLQQCVVLLVPKTTAPVKRDSYIYKEPTWCNLTVCLLVTAILLYMFQTLFASILRST